MAPEKNKFQKLTPVHDAKLSIYKDALDFVFENADIKNVAISGAYSAGKSSQFLQRTVYFRPFWDCYS